MEEEKKKNELNSFIRDIASRAFGYGLAIVLASIVLAAFPSCSAEPEKLVEIIPGLNGEITIPPIIEDSEDETPPSIEIPGNNNTQEDTEKPGDTTEPEEVPEPVVEYVEIATGYKIDKNGDYSKLIYPEDLEIVNGRIIYFRDSSGKSMYIRSSGSASASSPDNPSAVFAEDTITLKLRDLTLVFIKQ